MIANARMWMAWMGVSAPAVAGFICLTTPNAVAEPTPPPVPVPVTVTHTVTVAPLAVAPATAPRIAATPVTPAPAAGAPVVPAAGAPVVPSASLSPAAAATPSPANLAPGYPSALPSPVTPTLVPATSGTMRDYLTSKQVSLEPQGYPGFTALGITLPMPAGWSQVPDPNVPDAFAVIANRASLDLYTPNAQVVIYKLVGDFDPKEAITHGFVDSQSLMAWQTTDASLADFYGFPSSLIEGTYRQHDMTLNMSRRHVIATSGPDKYLVSLSVTSMANVQGAPSSADATDAVINGFRVTSAAPLAAAPLAPPAAAPPMP